jgi:hypothetical protein
MNLDTQRGADEDMSHTAKDAAAFHRSGLRTKQVSGKIRDHVRVAKRHGIWTVTEAGFFVGDYHDPDAALSAAEQARHRGTGSGEASDVADPWQRFQGEATP